VDQDVGSCSFRDARIAAIEYNRVTSSTRTESTKADKVVVVAVVEQIGGAIDERAIQLLKHIQRSVCRGIATEANQAASSTRHF